MAFQKLSPSFKLVKVAQRRKRGDITSIADQMSYSPSHVSNVLAGRRNNEAILNTAYRMAYRRLSIQSRLVEALA